MYWSYTSIECLTSSDLTGGGAHRPIVSKKLKKKSTSTSCTGERRDYPNSAIVIDSIRSVDPIRMLW